MFIIGILIGFIAYMYPKKYETIGTLYITRKVETGFDNYFKYEGYYALQNSSNQTLSIVEILDSEEIKQNIILQKSNILTKKDILYLNKNISIKKLAPQIIKVKTTAKSDKESLELWSVLVKSSIEKINTINHYKGDRSLYINLIDNPVTTQIYYPLYICLIFGFGISLSIYLFKIYIQNFIETRKK